MEEEQTVLGNAFESNRAVRAVDRVQDAAAQSQFTFIADMMHTDFSIPEFIALPETAAAFKAAGKEYLILEAIPTDWNPILEQYFNNEIDDSVMQQFVYSHQYTIGLASAGNLQSYSATLFDIIKNYKDAGIRVAGVSEMEGIPFTQDELATVTAYNVAFNEFVVMRAERTTNLADLDENTKLALGRAYREEFEVNNPALTEARNAAVSAGLDRLRDEYDEFGFMARNRLSRMFRERTSDSDFLSVEELRESFDYSGYDILSRRLAQDEEVVDRIEKLVGDSGVVVMWGGAHLIRMRGDMDYSVREKSETIRIYGEVDNSYWLEIVENEFRQGHGFRLEDDTDGDYILRLDDATWTDPGGNTFTVEIPAGVVPELDASQSPASQKVEKPASKVEL